MIAVSMQLFEKAATLANGDAAFNGCIFTWSTHTKKFSTWLRPGPNPINKISAQKYSTLEYLPITELTNGHMTDVKFQGRVEFDAENC